jgi:hypothetical protein
MRQAAERERDEAEAEKARREAARARQFVKVPNALLGRILDGGRASAYAAHLLAIKASKGSGSPSTRRTSPAPTASGGAASAPASPT